MMPYLPNTADDQRAMLRAIGMASVHLRSIVITDLLRL